MNEEACQKSILPDGVHPNAEGYKIMEQLVGKELVMTKMRIRLIEEKSIRTQICWLFPAPTVDLTADVLLTDSFCEPLLSSTPWTFLLTPRAQ